MLFATHHKCASSLASGYVLALCKLNQLTFSGTGLGDKPPSRRHDVSFRGNASYPFLAPRLTCGGVHIIRNPLNVVLSAYHSHLRTHTVENLPRLASQPRVLEQCSPAEGKALTLAFCERNDMFKGTPGPLCALREDDARFVTVRMEDFGDRVDLALRTAAGAAGERYLWPDAAAHTFRAKSGGRAPGEVDDASTYRSGDPEAWRRELPPPVAAYVRAHHRPLLERFYPEALVD